MSNLFRRPRANSTSINIDQNDHNNSLVTVEIHENDDPNSIQILGNDI